MRSDIGWGGERNIFYKGVETYPQQTRFKNLEGKLNRKAQRRQYLLAAWTVTDGGTDTFTIAPTWKLFKGEIEY